MVNIFEMSVRDGLQNEPQVVATQDKLWFAKALIAAGIQDLELGAFVRPDRVPAMADTEELYKLTQDSPKAFSRARLWALVPNVKGLERGISVGAKKFAIFTAASESFTQKNIGMTIQQSLGEFSNVIQAARKFKIKPKDFRGYVSTAFGCPFEGKIAPKNSIKVVSKLLEMGAFQVSVGDTIGVATPKDVEKVIKPLLAQFGPKKIAVHFHDTRGTALANTLRALELGVKTVDASAGGLGGCPFAPGATGNLATEDLLYMLDGMGIQTGVDLAQVCEASIEMSKRMNKPFVSRYLRAYMSKK